MLNIEELVVHLVAEDDSVMELSLKTNIFSPHSIEAGGLRIFSMRLNEPF